MPQSHRQTRENNRILTSHLLGHGLVATRQKPLKHSSSQDTFRRTDHLQAAMTALKKSLDLVLHLLRQYENEKSKELWNADRATTEENGHVQCINGITVFVKHSGL